MSLSSARINISTRWQSLWRAKKYNYGNFREQFAMTASYFAFKGISLDSADRRFMFGIANGREKFSRANRRL